MAGLNFIQFNNWEEVENFCGKNSFKLVKDKTSLVIAEILNKNNAIIGYISNRPQDFKPINPNTKYILVLE